MAGTPVFPYAHSRVILEDPQGEVVTADNAPWWANRIGRVRRLDPERVARIVEAVLDATEASVTASVRRSTPRSGAPVA